MLRPASRFGQWLLVLLVCLVVVAISTRVSKDMTFWGVVASLLLLAWLWSYLSHRQPPA